MLRGRDVLVVVHEQVLGLGANLVGYVLAFVQQLPCARDHVGVVDDGVVARVERGEVPAEEPRRLLQIGPAGLARQVNQLLGRLQRVLCAQHELAKLFHEPGEVGLLRERRPVLLLRWVVQHLADERELLRPGEEPRLTAVAEPAVIAAEQAQAVRVPGGDPDLVRRRAQLEQDLLGQRARRAPAVDEEQDPLLAGPYELEVTVAEGGRLSRPCRAHDERSPS